MHPSSRPLSLAVLCALASSATCVGQWDFDIRGFCRNNSNQQNLNPTLTNPSVTVYECWSVGIPLTQGLGSVQIMTTGTPCEGLSGSVQVKVPATPEDIYSWSVNQVADLNPPFPIAPCPPTAVIDYGRHTGNQSVYSFSIGGLFGGAPIIVKQVESEMTWNDTLTIVSNAPRTISLAIGSVANVVAAESFGSSATEARAKVRVNGSIGPASVDDMVEVVSVSTIPAQGSINVTRLLQLPLRAGTNTFPVQLTALAQVKATAQGAGLVAGSATAGVMFPNGLSFGPFLDANGGPLPPDVRIVGAQDDTVYEDTTRDARFVKMGFGLAGAAGVPVLAGSGPLTAGQTVQLDVSGAASNASAVLGVGVTTGFVPLLDGWLVPDVTTLGLTAGFATDATGATTISFPLPAGLPAGFETYFQAWILDVGAANGSLAATNGLQSLTPR